MGFHNNQAPVQVMILAGVNMSKIKIAWVVGRTSCQFGTTSSAEYEIQRPEGHQYTKRNNGVQLC